MAENQLPQPQEKSKTGTRRRAKAHDADDHNTVKLSTRNRKLNGIILASTKPSYCLMREIGSLQKDKVSLRSQHRKKLRRLLKLLLRKHNWSEASGVLSVLLKGTAGEKSISRNRNKYWATLLLLQHMNSDSINPKRMQNVYELWMKKLGPMKRRPTKDRFAAQIEFILCCLSHGKTEDAHQAALCLMQESGFESDAISNLVVGLTFYQLWYTTIPKELQLGELSRADSPVQSEELFEGRICMSIENSEGHEAVESQGTNFPSECDSKASVGNEKDDLKTNVHQSREVPMEVDDNQQRETHHFSPRGQDFYMKSAERYGHEETTSANHSDEIPATSIFYTRGLPPCLLPMQLPRSIENLENFLSMHGDLCNVYYKNAVKFLRVAFHSDPPVLEAFHPLIQMLLLGDQVEKAFYELERFPLNLDTALHLRVKSTLLEYFDHGNYTKLSAHFEEILRKDPTCSHSLGKLIIMNRSGDYSTEKLVEMIGLHLDAKFADWNTWKELTSCLFKLSHCEEDQMSTCFERAENGKKLSGHVYQIPAIFTNPECEYTWRLRCRWWLTRHFGQKTFQSDIAAGDVQLVTYKAATACYLYGEDTGYIAKATQYLETEKDMDMLSILRMHIQNSVGFYFSLDRKNLS